MRIVIDIDKPVPGDADREEYAKSIKNGVVLTSPDVHPPDVSVAVLPDGESLEVDAGGEE